MYLKVNLCSIYDFTGSKSLKRLNQLHIVWRETLEGANIGEFDGNHLIASSSIMDVLPNVRYLIK